MRPRRPFLAVTLLAAVAGLAACSGASTITSSAVAGATSSATNATSSATQTTVPASTQPTGSTHAAGGCSSIDQKTAESILGFPTAAGLFNAAASSSAMKKIDGCAYTSATAGGLGYDVVQIDAQTGQAMIGAIKSKMAGASTTPFDVGVPDSVSFTQTLPAGVDSQVTILSGDKLITVAATRKDGDVAKSQASATAAAKLLVSNA